MGNGRYSRYRYLDTRCVSAPSQVSVQDEMLLLLGETLYNSRQTFVSTMIKHVLISKSEYNQASDKEFLI